MTDRTPKVYVVQRAAFKNRRTGEWEDKYDMSSATKFGNLVYLLPPGNIAKDMRETMARLNHRLSDWTIGDYLLAAGDPVAIAAAAMIATHYSRGDINLLKWDGVNKEYNSYEVTIRY